MALRMTLIEGKGEFNYNRYQENLHIMLSLWEEIADLADFDKVCSRDIVSTTDGHFSWHDLDLSCTSFKFFKYYLVLEIVTRDHYVCMYVFLLQSFSRILK